MVSTTRSRFPSPVDELDEVEDASRQMVVNGFPISCRVRRWIEERLRATELMWPAEIAAEVVSLHDAYATGDSHFVAGRIP